MSRTKDHFTCHECLNLDTAVPLNGGFCNPCLVKHGVEFLITKHRLPLMTKDLLRISDRLLVVASFMEVNQ